MEHNNFDALRLIAAFAVLLSHSFPVTFGSDVREPLYRLSGGQTTIGTVAVAVFFVISGYLITGSFCHTAVSWSGVFRFVRARVLRIVPGLLVVLVILAVVVGPILSRLPAAQYFRNSHVLSFVVVNGSLLAYRDELPGVLEANPFPGAINGSLWTLKYEVRCYALVFLLGIAGWLRLPMVVVLYGISLVALASNVQPIMASFAAFFLAGAAFYLRPLPLRGPAAIACALVLAATMVYGGYSLAAPIVGPYLVLWLALAPSARLPRLGKYGDFSYGVYIYAFPIEQIVTYAMGVSATWYLNVLIASPLTFLCAICSWFFVERPALALKRAGLKPTRLEGTPMPSKQDGLKT